MVETPFLCDASLFPELEVVLLPELSVLPLSSVFPLLFLPEAFCATPEDAPLAPRLTFVPDDLLCPYW